VYSGSGNTEFCSGFCFNKKQLLSLEPFSYV
jgi:hypothetical protein